MNIDIRNGDRIPPTRGGMLGQAADSLAAWMESMVGWVEVENGLAVAATGRWIDFAAKSFGNKPHAVNGETPDLTKRRT